MENITMQVIIGLLVAFLVGLFSFFITPIKRKIWKILKLDIGTRYYFSRKNKKIYVFPKKQETRVSVSVLAKIEKDGKLLLKSKNPEVTRQDSSFKPLGGVVKLTKNMTEALKNDFRMDDNTRYSAKNNDFRIFINLINNKIIHKAIYSEKLSFYKNELVREIYEEMRIKKSEFYEIFNFKQEEPCSVQPHYTEPDFSVLKCHDYVHHIIFELEIKSEEKLKKLLLQRNKIKWIDLKDSKNKTITAHILNRNNKYLKFDDSEN